MRAQLIKAAIIAGQKVRDGLFKESANETSSCGIRKPNGAMNIFSSTRYGLWKFFLKKELKRQFLTNSCSPRSSITRTILAPIEPPIEHPFRNAARIKIGMLVLIVKVTATIKWSKVQKIAKVFILKWRERYPKMGRAMALKGFSHLKAQDLKSGCLMHEKNPI